MSDPEHPQGSPDGEEAGMQPEVPEVGLVRWTFEVAKRVGTTVLNVFVRALRHKSNSGPDHRRDWM